jgi:hypothetical protein
MDRTIIDELIKAQEIAIGKLNLEEAVRKKQRKMIEDYREQLKAMKVAEEEVEKEPVFSELEILGIENYPSKKGYSEKILYVIGTSLGRVCKINEIKNALQSLEGSSEAKILKSINYHVNNMFDDGLIMINQVNNSNRYMFYALPEFLDNGHIKPGREPEKSAWGELDEDKKVLDPNGWKGGSPVK